MRWILYWQSFNFFRLFCKRNEMRSYKYNFFMRCVNAHTYPILGGWLRPTRRMQRGRSTPLGAKPRDSIKPTRRIQRGRSTPLRAKPRDTIKRGQLGRQASFEPIRRMQKNNPTCNGRPAGRGECIHHKMHAQRVYTQYKNK